MKIKVTMTEEEMREFLQYREERKKRKSLRDRLQELANVVLGTIGLNGECEYAVLDQDDADYLVHMANVYAE